MQKSFIALQIPLIDLFQKIKVNFSQLHYDFPKHLVHIENEAREKMAYLRLPLHLSIDENLNVLNENTSVLYLSIESGNAALILKKGKETIYHTTFSAYMTRKKQGFSQIKYLNKKGKSRAGSRVRLAETTDFFEKINSKTTEIIEEYNIQRIALNCNKTLLPYLYQSKVTPPFNKKDERLYKIPLHIPQSNFNNLEAAIKKLSAPRIFYKEAFKNELSGLFELIKDL